MDSNALFTLALNLGPQWKVVESGFKGEPKQLELTVNFDSGTKFADPDSGELCPVHDTVEKSWRHLNFWQYQTVLTARVPRVRCPDGKVRMVPVPWAREGSGFTLMFEAFAMLLIEEMPVVAAAALLGCHDTRLWRVLKRYVDEAYEAADWSKAKNLAIDETSARRGHRYVTNVLDMEGSGRLLFMTEGKAAGAVTAFGEALEAHGGKKDAIESMALDMSAAFIKGTQETFPKAALVFDKFHLMQLAGKATDEVRKDLQREGADLKGSMWSLRGNEWNLSEEQQATRKRLCEQYEPLGKALGLRSALQDIFATGAPDGRGLLRQWCTWAERSKLKSFVTLAGTIRRHWDGIVNYFKWQTTSARMEAINGVLQTLKRRARGYRNFTYFRAMAYWVAGKLTLNLPDLA